MDASNLFSKDCKIPEKEEDITAEWIQKAVGKHALNDSISVTGNIQTGVGFLSNLCRVSFRTEAGGEENILVKLLPSSPDFRSLTISNKFDMKEIQFYSIVQPRILDVSPQFSEYLCKYFCGSYKSGNSEADHGSMLVLEDLKPLGYTMLVAESDNWKENLEEINKFSAKLHAASVGLEKVKNLKIAEIFPFCMGMGDNKPDDSLMNLARGNSPRLIEFLAGCPEEVVDGYKFLDNHIESVFPRVSKEGSKCPVIIHGDIWPPNVMVNESSGRVQVKIIDWQLLGYRDASFELTIAILNCLPKSQLTMSVIESMARMYYCLFIEYCKSLGVEGQVRSEDDFLKFFNTWGMSYAFMWFLLGFDSYPEDQERLKKVFIVIQEEYKISNFLAKEMQLM